ncbi:hypothetical protein GGS20DRAFT_486555 [Poronia punctata]|nr:hypothetical protein GGS20DRAFT_486555 [Poronia punctata]
MTEYIEARSLAALNQLAANPPQYPKKPTEARHDALTLYISRVPGTRDIILSTLKPQLKNVTFEDVASSLYYVHLQTPEDEALMPPNQSGHSPSPRSSGESPRPQPQIHRKPLPATSSQAPAGKENSNLGVPARKPVPGQTSGTPPEHQPPLSASNHRTPLGPRPLPHEPTQPYAPPLPDVPRPPLHNLTPPLPARPGNGQLQPESAPTSGGSSPTRKRPFIPFSLTLIRRDPASGQQWNVGKIASFQLDDSDLLDDEKYQQHSPSIQIHLETSGYAKFRGMPAAGEAGFGVNHNFRPGSASSAPSSQGLNAQTGTTASGAFERQIKMTYSPSFTASLRQRFRRRSSTSEGRPLSPVKRAGHGRNQSQTSVGSFGGSFDGSEAPIITHPAPGLKPRGYIFYSPWNGRCEFVTGNAGRSLRCRHTLPSYSGGVYNPLVEGSDAENEDEKPDQSNMISELRFNLPSNELLTDKRSTEGSMRARDQIQSQFHKMVAKAQGLEDSDEDFHFDLSLGRERAGGGNRGTRAKMGKLIIFDEGLKMLDLAVAANVGIWWTTWERTY